ncbi:MFS general substrate transporter [Wolfiporia cocos MD-104 SS10]|uniref:MFS general substrate transporter n=1 Tax=Wolfiporia cocos (strain MD-104) TaxID=742152 RepID=A0A2H3JS55_WOLCO|nr:MFS general substrate transporter [Wolfiporia cocos MD-104 SS10]
MSSDVRRTNESESSVVIDVLEKTAGEDIAVLETEDVFYDEVLAKHFVPPDSYEGKHRFDPKAVWAKEEEQKLIRKIDTRIMLFCCICFSALQLDRGNLSNALSDNMLKDLGLTTDDYNTGNTLFFVSFLFMEIPSQLISKRIGVERWVPMQMVLWSVVAISQCALNGRKSFWATRALLGMFEGGFIPDMVLYLSYFYKGDELPVRLSWFWGTDTLTSVIGALLAAGILQLRGANGWEGWRYLFLIEGVITLSIGAVALVYLPPSPTQTASFFRGRDGWFTKREETVMVTRVLRDDPTKSDMHNRQSITLKLFWQSLTDYDMAPLYALGLMAFIPLNTFTNYFTLNLKELGFSTFETNLLTVPGSFLSVWTLLGIAWLSRRLQQRALVTILGSLIASNIYRSNDAPYYHRGNRVLLGLCVLDAVLMLATKAWYMWRNAQRERAWDAMTSEQKDTYLSQTKGRGNKRLNFRSAH